MQVAIVTALIEDTVQQWPFVIGFDKGHATFMHTRARYTHTI